MRKLSRKIAKEMCGSTGWAQCVEAEQKQRKKLKISWTHWRL